MSSIYIYIYKILIVCYYIMLYYVCMYINYIKIANIFIKQTFEL